ncbi:2-dehydro-3-deoxygluconokinase [Hyunsoonleella jejuensis]|uniref:2-dehydro-3-deoxygluconokinase n=1 Tax=Hyunsoonleella jejuensis TaxID=419940 RepID=A0A1H9KNT5_9FLAO|nr:sugar kinase [Hyunsoonleella jejuensis]SER00752.1 2-dehydro-3-deoxygluconokinase [Hyunsoonleella jejuensis]
MSFITFGEIMMRLTPSNYSKKINSSSSFNVDYAGSESNVASSLGVLGNKVSFVTKLPENQLGDAAIRSLRAYGIDTNNILRGGHRIGTYIIELGASIRPSSVIYDRKNSSFSEIENDEFKWENILKDKKWIFLSGITPVLSKQCAEETIKVSEIARKLGVKVAFDMNYRRSLWKDPADARKIFDKILVNTDLLFGNADVLKDVYNMNPTSSSRLDITKETAHMASAKFGIKHIAFTIREHSSASVNKVSGFFLSNSRYYSSKIIEVAITDRFGTGDAFAAAFLHGIIQKWNDKKVIDFATAAFALKHTIQGDQHTSSEKEIISIMKGHISGHVLR